ncbi:MAG: hypothetical protein H3C49_03380, partial [Alphaproteobacteria bacterium]|nr:hypothetical protein [Alphaproteobacteria bacterium]
SVYVDGAPERLFGQTVNVRIEKAFQNGMSGSIETTETTLTSNKKAQAA